MLSSAFIIILTSQVSGPAELSDPYFGLQAPGNKPVLFAEGIIPDDLHSAPVFSADGKTVFYKPLDGKGIMVMKDDGEGWGKPFPLFVDEGVDNSDDPCLDPAGEMLYFTLYDKGANREYIYSCMPEGPGGCIPEMPAGALNDLDLHWQFSVADNGNIYFASNGNIYLSAFSKGTYLTPTKLDTTINTSLSECTPWVSPDEQLLIFARSNGDKPDLFVSRRDDSGKWGKAEALGHGINTEHHEMCPRLSPDGKYLFFLSSRGGLFSAYWIDAGLLFK